MTNGELANSGSNGWLKFVAVCSCLVEMFSGSRSAGEKPEGGKYSGRGSDGIGEISGQGGTRCCEVVVRIAEGVKPMVRSSKVLGISCVHTDRSEDVE